jgi:hypothetical protein
MTRVCKRRFKSLKSIMKSLLNYFYNKYNQNTICIKICEESVSSYVDASNSD